MKISMNDVYSLDKCRKELFQAIEDELLQSYKNEGYEIKQWEETLRTGGGRGPRRRNAARYYMLASPPSGQGILFRLEQHVISDSRQTAMERKKWYTADRKAEWSLDVSRGSGKSASAYRILKYLLPIAFAAIGWGVCQFTPYGNPKSSWGAALVGGVVGYVIYSMFSDSFFKIYSRLAPSSSPGGADLALKEIELGLEPIVKRVKEKWEEKDAIYSPEKLEEKGYEAIDLEIPENLAQISYEQVNVGQDETWRKYGLYIPERRKVYEAKLKELSKAEGELYRQYLEAYNKLAEKD